MLTVQPYKFVRRAALSRSNRRNRIGEICRFQHILLLLLSHSVGSDSLQPHGLQHTRLPCPSPSPGVRSNSCPLSWWCHPTISTFVAPFSSCLQSFPASGSLPMTLAHWNLIKIYIMKVKVAQSCPTLWDPIDCSMPGFPVLHHLPEFTQTHVHWVSDTIQPSHPLSSPPFAFNLSQHQGLFKRVSSSHQVAKILEFQL